MGRSSAPTLRELYERELRAHDYCADPTQLRVVERLEALRTQLAASAPRGAHTLSSRLLRRLTEHSLRPARGLYLWGPVGRGKTWLMDLFYQSLPFPERRRRHFHRFMHDVHAQLHDLGARPAPLECIATRLADATRVLCFDELYVTDIADAMILGGLFAGLFRRGVTLVATSNVPPAQLYHNGLQRQRFLPAIELLERHTEVLAVDGSRDYRLRQLTQGGTYLMAADAGTPERLRQLFATLSAHAAWTDGEIRINDRPIPVVRHTASAVWFEFAALCSGPRSQEDYIEIARSYCTVVLSGVPQLDAPHDDETRRFIALVDELYDRRVKLVIAAASPPQQLYRGERLRAEFERAASRLIEMQSCAYLAGEHRP
jgi:cell division protein ZapE